MTLSSPHVQDMSCSSCTAPVHSFPRTLFIFALIILWFFLPFSASPSLDASQTLPLIGIFGIGILASFSTCSALLAGVLAGHASTTTNGAKKSWKFHTGFHFGRFGSFLFFGFFIGVLGSTLRLSPAANGFLFLLIACLLLFFGLHLAHWLPPSWRLKAPARLSRLLEHSLSLDRTRNAWIAGALTFFLPCGFTQAVQLYALALGNPWLSSLTLGIFALGTVPVLLGIGMLFGSIKGRLLIWAKAGVSAVMIALSLQTGLNGLALLNLLPATAPSTQTTVATQTQETQIISMQVTSDGTYAPDTFVVKKNVPVVWNIERADRVGCADSLVLSAFHIYTPLQKGDNTITFTPDRIGRFTFSCAMGMIRGTLIVE